MSPSATCKGPDYFEKQRVAHKLFQAAVRDGQLIREPCQVCGNPKSEGHHADYGQPLEVQWLCRVHHQRLHAALGPPPRSISFNGEALLPKEWAARTGVHESTICRRIDKDRWPVVMALTLKSLNTNPWQAHRFFRAARECLVHLQDITEVRQAVEKYQGPSQGPEQNGSRAMSPNVAHSAERSAQKRRFRAAREWSSEPTLQFCKARIFEAFAAREIFFSSRVPLKLQQHELE